MIEITHDRVQFVSDDVVERMKQQMRKFLADLRASGVVPRPDVSESHHVRDDGVLVYTVTINESFSCVIHIDKSDWFDAGMN